MSDHSHYGEYAEARHDHRGEYADDRHDHDLDYAGKHHAHFDLERQDESLRGELRGVRDWMDEAEQDLSDARVRIRALEAANTQLAAAMTTLADAYVQVCLTGMASETYVAIAEELSGVFHGLADVLGTPPAGDALASREEITPLLRRVRQPAADVSGDDTGGGWDES